jgi:hypothetical protein
MSEPHPTFYLHNGFFRIANRSLKLMSTFDPTDTRKAGPAAS